MVGSIIKWKVSNKAISEWTCLCSLLLLIMIGVKSFYLHHAESSLEVHSLTTYIFASNSFKCNFWIYVFETWHLTFVCSSVQVLCKDGLQESIFLVQQCNNIYLQGCSNIKSDTLEHPCVQLFGHFCQTIETAKYQVSELRWCNTICHGTCLLLRKEICWRPFLKEKDFPSLNLLQCASKWIIGYGNCGILSEHPRMVSYM